MTDPTRRAGNRASPQIARLSRSLDELSATVKMQGETLTTLSNQVESSLAEFTKSLVAQRADFQIALTTQQTASQKATNDLVQEVIVQLQSAIVSAVGRKLIDWLWTAAFGLLISGIIYGSTHLGSIVK